MKLHFSLGAAALALMIALPAHGQTYTKGDERLMNDAQRMEPEYTQPAPEQTSQAETFSYIEPAAGSDSGNPYADFTGFYGGGDIGYGISSAERSGAGTDGDVGLDGVNGDVFIGYGFEHTFNWLGGYAGIEAAYEWSGQDGNLGGVEYEKDNSWNVTFRPGLTMHKDTLGYGIVGYSRADFETASADDSFDGMILGAGAEFDTNTAFKTRLEYTYTNYEDSDLGGTSFDPHENNIKLGIVFRL